MVVARPDNVEVKIKMGGDTPQKADINANATPQDPSDPWALPVLEDQGVKWSGNPHAGRSWHLPRSERVKKKM